MKTITLEVNEEVAEKLLAMESNKRSLFLKFFTDKVEKGNWEGLFSKTTGHNDNQESKEKEFDKLIQTVQTIFSDRRTLEEIMRDAQEQAERNGLTEEKLNKILKDLK